MIAISNRSPARIAYFDCYSGISGDMTLGALLDAGLDAELLRREIARLGLPGVELHIARRQSQGIAGTHVRVET